MLALDDVTKSLIEDLLEASPSGVFVLDQDIRIVWVNSVMLKMLGVERERVLGVDKRTIVRDWIPGMVEDGHEVSRRLLATYEGPPKPGAIVCHLLQDGQREERWIEHHSHAIRHGPLAGGRVEFCQDVTDRIRAEEAVERLATSAEEQAFVLGNMAGFAYRHDAQGVFHYLSPSIERLTGYTPEEWEQHYTTYLTDNPLNEQVVELTEQTLASGVTNEPYKVEVRHKNGSRIMLEVTERPYFEDGCVAGIVGIANDITARQRAEDERVELEARLQHAQKLESLGILAGGIAHDFNNLLTTVLGNAGLALDETDAASPVREHLEEIVRASRHAADLCRQMLAYSGKGTFTVRPLDLSEVVAEMADMLAISISKKVRLDYDFGENLPPVEGDATQIQQIVLNLITNASEAIGDRTGEIHVRTGVGDYSAAELKAGLSGPDPSPGTYVWLEVEDTGEGIDERTRSKMFDPFFTTKFTGRGLGLSTVLGIARGHDGAIAIETEVGRGTRFRVLFPAGHGQPARTRPAPLLEPGVARGTVLLVDDEPPVRKVARRMLEKLGYDVLTAGDGKEGLELFRAHRDEIACVLLDMTMPEMSGDEVFRAMRALDPDVRVLLASGYDEAEATRRIDPAIQYGFLRKPYEREGLAAKLREVLGESP